MISIRSNAPATRPAFCIQRHHCTRKGGKCSVGCSWWDFEPRSGDATARRNAEKAEKARA